MDETPTRRATDRSPKYDGSMHLAGYALGAAALGAAIGLLIAL